MHSLSPYNGMQKVLFQQFSSKDNPPDLRRIIAMMKDQLDYDADKQKPVAGAWTKDREPPTDYLRRLEDIDESWVRKYLENVLVGIKTNKSGGLREYSSQNREAITLVGTEGEVTEEGELLVDSGEFSPIDIAEAKSKLPYLLKRLHDKSLLMRVSAMSLIIAYEKAKVVTKFPRPKDILEAGVYKMQADGNLDGIFPSSANSGKVFPPACNWIRGYAPDSYFDDAIELIRICRVLGIDIKEESPLDYQAKDIANLKVTYISKNLDYLNGSRKRNLSVLDSLSSVSVSDYAVVQKPTLPISVRVMNTIQAVLDCDNPDIRRILEQQPDANALNSFFKAYGESAKDFRVTRRHHMEMLTSSKRVHTENPNELLIPTLDDFLTRDGFLYSPKSDAIPQLFRVKKYIEEGMDADIAIAHSSGYFFLVTSSNCIYYLDAVELEAYVKDCQRGVFTNRYAKNHKYGRWDMCFV